MTTASFVSSLTTGTAGCISTFIAIYFISSLEMTKERYPLDIVLISILHITDWYIGRQDSLRPVQPGIDFDPNDHCFHYMLYLKE